MAAASPGNDAFGAALLNLGSATVTACIFTGNQATGGGSTSYYAGSYGAGIESFDGSTLSVSWTAFTGNESNAASGAYYGVAAAIDVEFSAVATISHCSFTENVAYRRRRLVGSGPAPSSPKAASSTLSNSSLDGNQAIGASFSNSVPQGSFELRVARS